jgi:hypothetical protein
MSDLSYKVYVVMQAYKLEMQGVKKFPKLENDFIFEAVSIFPSLEDAQNYMAALLINIKKDIKNGVRDEYNLHKEKGLDFCVVESTINIPTQKMLDRNWIIK